MSRAAVSRNYAEALFELAAREDATVGYGELLDLVAGLYRDEAAFRLFLETPRVSIEAKREVIRETLGERAPENLVRFLLVVLEKRRQRALPAIATTYRELLDEEAGRVQATVAAPFEPDRELQTRVVRALEAMLGRTVEAHFREEPSLIGGLRVRVGDQVMDGSLRRRLEDLRRDLVTGRDGARA